MCQQHPQFLTAYRLHMHRTIKPRPHHLRYAARIVAVRLVDLRLQHRLHVPRLNADHRQSCFGESAEQPLRQRSSFQPNSLEVVSEVLQHRQQCFRFARHLYFPNDLACVIHNADARLLDRNVQSSKMVHAALLLLMLEAVFTDLVSPSARSAAPKIFSYPQAAGRLPHLLAARPTFLQLFQPFPIAVRIPVVHERGVARMSPNHTPGMFDWTPILLSAPRDLANICNQSIRVGTIGAIELFERVQVSKMVPVEYQIFATAHLRYSI